MLQNSNKFIKIGEEKYKTTIVLLVFDDENNMKERNDMIWLFMDVQHLYINLLVEDLTPISITKHIVCI